MWSCPVMLGGGIMTVKGSLSASGCASKNLPFIQKSYILFSKEGS